MIPDIALMIVIYGGASLLIRALTQHRTGTGTLAQASVAIVWVLVVIAGAALAYLGYDVLRIAGSVTSGVPGLT